MSEQLDRRERDFSKFDSMTTETLQQILRLDAMKPEGEESDTEELLYIMEVLADRRRNDSTYTGKTPQQAFEDFQKYYMPEDAAEETTSKTPEFKSKPSARWLHRLGTLAAALAIAFFTTLTANALGFDLFGKVAKWSAEFFHFEHSPDATISPATNPDNGFASLQQALDACHISNRIAPTWFPNGYEIVEVTISESPFERVIFSKYRNNSANNELLISIRQLLDNTPFEIEKSDDFVEIYSCEGVAYHIFSNYNRVRAVWVVDEFECLITGSISIEELKDIIDSIQ